MKKNNAIRAVMRSVGALLSVAVALTSIPIPANAEEVGEMSTVVDADTVTEEKDAEIKDIFTFNWKDATIAEINEAVYDCDNADLGVWLKSMPKEELEELLKLDTYLHNKTEVTDYSVDEDGEMTAQNGSTKTLEYYEYALSQVPENNKGTAKNSSGYYYYKFKVGGVSYDYKMAISGLETGKSLSAKQQKVSLALSIPSGVPGWLEFRSNKGTSTTSASLQAISDTEYKFLNNAFCFVKPAGYTLQYSCSPMVGDTMFWQKLGDGSYLGWGKSYSDNTTGKVAYNWGEVDVHLRDMGIDTAYSDGTHKSQHTSFVFTFTPITYYVGYGGNGATSGSTTAQTCAYDASYALSPNGYTRAYNITYNANGGTASKPSETVSYGFAGWQASNGAVYAPGAVFSNLTTTNGASVWYNAIWTPQSTNLATASRTGYTFGGWVNHLNGLAYAGGASYTPPANTHMTAAWTPNKYTINFNSNGGSACSPIAVTYDQNATLPTPTRAGYKFLGWNGPGGTYTGTVKNLSSVNGATVTLTAQWEVSHDTPYQVLHYKQTGTDPVTNTPVFDDKPEIENLKGTTGDTITAAVKDYGKDYVIPTAQTQQIKADGTTKFIYRYLLYVPEVVDYHVEHYLENAETGKYELKDRETAKGEENTSVTPDVRDTYVGYDAPNPQTVILAEDGSTVVKYYYKAKTDIPYTVVHRLQDGDNTEEFVEYETEEKQGTTGKTIQVATKSYPGYDAPEKQTVTVNGDGSTYVVYDYTAHTDTAYKVVHRLQSGDDAEKYTTKETEDFTGTTGSTVMPETKDYAGYELPDAKTVKINGDGSTVVTYDYKARTDTPYQVVHRLQSGDNLEKFAADIVLNTVGTTGKTITPGTRKYAGYDAPEKQTVQISGDGTTVVVYDYTARSDVSYRVVHRLQSAENPEEYVETTAEQKIGTAGASVTPPTKNFAGYDAPELYTDVIAGDGTTVITYDYDIKRDIPYKVIHRLQNASTGRYVVDEIEEFCGATGETISPEILNYAGYVIPDVQTTTINGDGTTIVTYDYALRTNIPYKVVHMVQKAIGSTEYVEKETEDKKGTTGESVTPDTKSYDGYVAPAKQTVTIEGDGSTVVTYKYDVKIRQQVTYKVEHYLQNKNDKSKYDLADTKEYTAEEDSFVTPAVISTYTGYEVPTAQTTVVKPGMAVIKYYYKLAYVEDGKAGDVNNFKAGDVKYYTDKNGNEYEILVNSDGTLTVRAIKAAASSKETITITDTITINGVKYQVTEIAPRAFKNNKKIKTVKIGNGIKKIGKEAFKGCTKLTKVTFGTSLSVIGSSAFYGCTSLTTVKTNKALVEIGSKAFYNCKKLKSYTIGKYVKKIGDQAFQNCKTLKSITISESVETIGKKAFYNCSKIKTITFKTTKLLKVGKQAFKKCAKKPKITVPEKKQKDYQKLLKGKY